MNYDEEWIEDPNTQKLIKALIKLRESHLQSMIGVACTSTDLCVQEHAVAIKTIERLLLEISQKNRDPEESEDA